MTSLGTIFKVFLLIAEIKGTTMRGSSNAVQKNIKIVA
jgi:hypothetical protein